VTVLRRHRWLQATILLGPALMWMALFVLVPAVITVITSFWGVVNYRVAHVWQVDNYTRLIQDPLYYTTLARSLEKAAITGVIAAALSIPLAWTIVFRIRRRRLFALGIVVMALWMGYLLRAYGWRLVFGADGVVNTILQSLGLTHHPLSFLLFNDFAVIVVLVHLSLPFAFVPIYLAFERLPRALLDASSDLGATRARTATHVVLPIVGNSIWAGATFAFIISFGDYFAPQLVGAPSSAMIGNIATSQFGAAVNWPFGDAIGVAMVAVVFFALVVPFLLYRAFSMLRRTLFQRSESQPVPVMVRDPSVG
jgi:spermidine/putrescine transport system permease protein